MRAMKKATMYRVVSGIMAILAICILASTAFAGKVVYDYEPTGQLTSITAPASNTSAWFSHDPSGNIRHISSDLY